jgi:hypothetical protein
MSVPSPATQAPIKLKDVDVGFAYVEFPDDTFFMESLAQNESFRTGVAYVPVQRFVNGREESHLYEITALSAEAKHIAGPIAAPDSSTDLTIFGSALSSDGLLYMCAFNRNSVVAYDLKKLPETVQAMTCTLEVKGLSAPNDVCLDPKDENVLYVVGGTFRKLCCCLTFSNSTYGRVYKVELSKNNNISVQADELKTLAGVEFLNDTLWIAQLFEILKQDRSGASKPPAIAWKGLDAQNQVWLADNIDVFGGDKLICPAYSTAPAAAIDKVMSRTWLVSSVLFFVQMATAFMRGERLRRALRDPEVSLSFSNTYIQKDVVPAPIRLIFLDGSSGHAVHFEIDLAETRKHHQPRVIKSRKGKTKGERHFFNEQVTHAAHLNDGDHGFVACVNFEQPRILLLNDKVFRDAMIAYAVTS